MNETVSKVIAVVVVSILLLGIIKLSISDIEDTLDVPVCNDNICIIGE